VAHVADALDMDKFESLAVIYERYAERMQERYYDYNDMISTRWRCSSATTACGTTCRRDTSIWSTNSRTRIMRRCRCCACFRTIPCTRGANIMWWGRRTRLCSSSRREVSNILDFERMYREPQLIVLKENYRSTQPILDLARRVIAQGTNRLERMIPTLKKELVGPR